MDEEFDNEFAQQMAALESYNKHLYRPNTYLHKWWARRCGSTFRLILKGLVEEAAARDYYAPGGLEGRVILDPMMGGGTTLHEAIRLGAGVIGADIDPIPVLQARASLSESPLAGLEAAFEGLWQGLRGVGRDAYRTACPTCGRETELQFVLYGQRRACACGPALFLDSTILRHAGDGTPTRICPICHAVYQGEAHACAGPAGRPPVREKETTTCGACGAPYREDYGVPYYARYMPAAIMSRCPQHGPILGAPAEADMARLRECDARRAGLDFGPAEDFAVRRGPKSGDLLQHGIRSYLDLFSSRQLLYLHGAMRALPALEPLTRLNLALLVSTSLEFNSMLCGYKGGDPRRPGAIRHTFSHHAYSFPYTALENNPLYPAQTSGTLRNLFEDRIGRGRRWAARPVERRVQDGKAERVAIVGEVDAGVEVYEPAALRAGPRRFLLLQGSSAKLGLEAGSVDFVVTDPPYSDSVQYGDLAAFFRVWLRRLIPEAADWEYDLAEAAVDAQADGQGQYATVLGAIFAECRRVLRKDHGRLIFTFHHWNPKAWAALTLALRRAQFRLVNRYAVHAENPASVHISNLRALTHDAILVLAPAECGAGRAWARPAAVDGSDSRAFCEDCAGALGWMLDSALSDAEVERSWRALLKGGKEDSNLL